MENEKLLEQIAKDVKKASFWIRFWSILGLVSYAGGIAYVIYTFS